MQTIYINARFLSQPVTGVQRYAVDVVRALDKLIDDWLIDGHSFALVVPYNLKCSLELKHILLERVGALSGHLWGYTRKCDKKRTDSHVN